MWQGNELSGGASDTVKDFPLWIALPPEREITEPETHYLEADVTLVRGLARLIVGSYGGLMSRVRSPSGDRGIHDGAHSCVRNFFTKQEQRSE